MSNTAIALVAISAPVFLGRFFVPGHGLSWPGSYEAAAHIWVGFLAATFAYHRDRELGLGAIALLTLLSMLELVKFLAR